MTVNEDHPHGGTDDADIDFPGGPAADEDEFEDDAESDLYERLVAQHLPQEPPGPVNWNLLRSHELEAEWLELNQWVNWLRHTYGLPASVIPPFWYRHSEVQWELSALRSHWLSSYDRAQVATGPLAWHKEFAAARVRLRDWVATCGTRIDTDRPTRQTTWPGESPQPPIEDEVIPNREKDFLKFVAAHAAARQAEEDEEATRFLRENRG